MTINNAGMPTIAIWVTANRYSNPRDFVANDKFQSCDVHKRSLEPMKQAFGTARIKLARQCRFGERIEPAP